MSDSGAAPGTVATAIRVDSVVTPSVTVPQTSDTPDIWIAANTPFTVSATTVDATNTPAPLSFTKDVTVNIRAVSALGTTHLGSTVVPKDTTAISVSGLEVAADIDNAVIQLVSVERRGDPVRQGQSVPFDIQSQFSDNAQPPADQDVKVAIGGAVTGSDCQPTIQSKICYEMNFPAGSVNSSHLLSLGNCNVFNPCKQELDYFWSIVDVHASRDNPVITDMGLDKSLKGVTFDHGVPKARWLFRVSGSETWAEAPDCPSRGVVGQDQTFCQDTSQSHRDNSGDTWIRLLWLEDARGSLK